MSYETLVANINGLDISQLGNSEAKRQLIAACSAIGLLLQLEEVGKEMLRPRNPGEVGPAMSGLEEGILGLATKGLRKEALDIAEAIYRPLESEYNRSRSK